MSPATLRQYRNSAFASHLFLLILTGWILCLLPVQAGEWTYKDGSNGPNQWPGMCQVGTRQSPIDLDPQVAVPGHFEPLVLLNYDKPVAAKITNNGHSVVLHMEQSCEMVMAAGGLRAVYRLEQIHFHWESEHTFLGKRWPLEMHMVHYNRQFKTLSEAAKRKRGLAVLGVLFYETEKPNDGFLPILESMSNVTSTEGIPFELLQQVTVQDLLPRELNYYYRYDGSLTTPNCDESVVWTVLVEPLPISGQQVMQFHEIESKNEPLKLNYRPVQKVNNRRIYLQQPSETYQESYIYTPPPSEDDQEISSSSRLYQSYFIVTAVGIFSMVGRLFP